MHTVMSVCVSCAVTMIELHPSNTSAASPGQPRRNGSDDILGTYGCSTCALARAPTRLLRSHWMAASALDVARYLIQLAAAEDEPEELSHLRLQKLLYYVQGWSLAQRGEAMFPDRIEAWAHGP